jgi:hypothetical protein
MRVPLLQVMKLLWTICMVVPIACLLKYTTIQGIKFHHVDMNDLDNITDLINENTK